MPKALITGGAGFIGSHISEYLLSKNYKVATIDNLSTGHFGNIKHLVKNPNFSFTIEDIRNEQVIDRLMSEADVVFHLAAVVGVFNIINSPTNTIETNIDGTEIILKTAKRYKTKVMIASTSEVYGKSTKIPFSEDDDIVRGSTTKSRWSYAATKELDEFLGLAYHQEHQLPVVVFRLFNTVGPRQQGHYGMVLPRFVKWALKNEPIQIYGDGTQSRCFANVSDVVKAITALSESKKAEGQVFNIGSSEEITIENLAKKIIKITKSKSKIIKVPYEKAYGPGFEDMLRRVPNTTKIKKLIKWQPTTSLDKTIQEIVKYENTN